MALMHIRQLSFTYDVRQDRLLLSVLTSEAQELRFWFTRRLVERLTKPLQNTIAELDARHLKAQTLSHTDKEMLSELQHQHTLEHGQFGTRTSDASDNLPSAEDPMLVSTLQMTLESSSAHLRLTLGTSPDAKAPDGHAQPHCNLRLNSDLAHGLLHLLHQCLDHAQWNLPNTGGLEASVLASHSSEEKSPPSSEDASAKPPYLH